MQDGTLVTVICSCYNHQNYVIESIQSVLNQTYKNVQLIIIDDNSTDNSVEIIETFIRTIPEIIFIKNSTNLGLNKSVSNAMQYVEGTHFIDLASDDNLLPHCIESQVETYRNSIYNDLAIVYGNAELITESGKHSSYYFDINSSFKSKSKRPSGDIYCNVISLETVICSVSALYSKAIFERLNGYDTNLSYEDLDYWIRASRTYNIEFIDSVLMQKRIVKNSLQTTLYSKKNKNSDSTYVILNKAYHLNKNKNEHRMLKKRVNFEIINSYRTRNYILMIKNLYLRFKISLSSI